MGGSQRAVGRRPLPQLGSDQLPGHPGSLFNQPFPGDRQGHGGAISGTVPLGPGPSCG